MGSRLSLTNIKTDDNDVRIMQRLAIRLPCMTRHRFFELGITEKTTLTKNAHRFSIEPVCVFEMLE